MRICRRRYAKWAGEELVWGIFEVPESQLAVLPEELEGKEAIELGCSTGYVSAWLARRGARPAGIDNSEARLAPGGELIFIVNGLLAILCDPDEG